MRGYRIRKTNAITEQPSTDGYLCHYGIKGQRWGIRRFQNENGTYTAAGKERYAKYSDTAEKSAKAAKTFSYYRQQTENEGKRRGQAWSTYGKLEAKYAKKAIKSQEKANKYAIDSDKKDMRKLLSDEGIEVDKYSEKSQRKAEAAEFRAVLKSKSGDEERAGKSAYDKALAGVDYKTGNGVGEYVWSLHSQYRDAANKDSVYRKHEIGQDTAFRYIEDNKKFKDMVDYIVQKTSASNKKALNASSEFSKSKETTKKPGAKFEAMNKASVEYWDNFNDTATKYIDSHFSGEEADIAKALVFWRFIDW